MAERNENTTHPESVRLTALRQYGVLDSAPEQGYEDIAELAAYICGTPISLVSFVDQDRQWFKAVHGLGVRETPRSESFCANTIVDSKTLIVNDATLDERFRSNPLVLGNPHIRFYAGAPIIEKGGHVLGTVCVIDSQPRTLDGKQQRALEALARQVVVLLEQRKAIADLEETANQTITAHRQIRESERRLKIFVDTQPNLAWMADADGYIFWYNRQWYEYTGTAPQQMEGWGWQSVHDPATLPAVMERWTASIRTGKPFEMIFPLRGADGILRPFLTRAEPMWGETGQLEQWIGTNVEVDALQKVQLALGRSEAGLSQVLKATSDAVMSMNRDWTLTYMNPKAEELYGRADALVGRSVWEAFPDTASPDSPFWVHYRQAMNEGVAGSFETEYGEPLNFTIGLEVYPSDEGIVTFSRDITRLKHAAAAVLQNEKLAAVGRLASSIAHEINNPLESVTNLLYLARTCASLDEVRGYLDSADQELRRASAITTQTLRFHRQATAPMRATFAQLAVGIFTGQHSRLLRSRVDIRERNRSVRPVLCLEGEIRQVLTNLISNAIDAMHGLGGTLFVRGRDGRNWKTGKRGMVITVADTGAGMSETTKAKVFEAFYTTKGIGGTGLGLWISKEIVDRHRGMLSVRTSQGKPSSGTVFTLFLPESDSTPDSSRREQAGHAAGAVNTAADRGPPLLL